MAAPESGGMRELRVEDALMYLDQVKLEFGDRPRIYNEFLDIMKTFKSQQIDTPGVIQRVSNLFQGNKNLVLGFNTFLPEGYKIELPLDESGQPFAVYRSPGQAGVTQILAPNVGAQQQQAPQPPPQQQQPPHMGAPPQGAAGYAAAGYPQGQMPPGAMQVRGVPPGAKPPGPPRGAPPPHMHPQGMPGGMGPPPPPPPPQQQPPPSQQQAQQQPPVEFDHAINYVTTIKKRFASQPETYKKFLEILHTYQKEQRGIKDVLDEVSALFADHPDLLKDFTYFLPDAVQAQAKAQLEQVAKLAEARKMASASKQAIMATAGRQRPGTSSVGQGTGGNRGAASPYVGGQAAGGGQRMVHEPIPFGATQGRSEDKEREICRTAIYGIVSFDPIRPPRRNEVNAAQASAKYGRPRMVPELPVQPTTTESAFFQRARAHLTRKELLPDKSPLSRRHTPHAEFLKCLHLFGAGLLNRDELMLLLKGLFMQGHAPKSGVNAGGGAANAQIAAAANDLMKELEGILMGRGPYADQERAKMENSKYGAVAVRDYDYGDSDRPTPSYRTLPTGFPKKSFYSHSGQSEEDASVLNHTAVCVPPDAGVTGLRKKIWDSPDQYDGVKERKNFYEETMMKIEEDHFEVDMAIERNAAAKRQVDPLAEEASLLRENEEKDGQPIGRLRYKLRSRSLSSNHIGAIARLYGNKGDEVLHHLSRNPLCVLPIVWRRLNEKDAEWRKARTELTQDWKIALKENHEGANDVKCYFERKEIERSLASEVLLQECEDAGRFAKDAPAAHAAVQAILPTFEMSSADPKAIQYQPHLKLRMSDAMPHSDAVQCLMVDGNNVKAGVSRILADFIVPFFNISPSVAEELMKITKADKPTNTTKYSKGQIVKTVFGDGEVLSTSGLESSTLMYEVKLSTGIALIRPSAIVQVLPGATGPIEQVEGNSGAIVDSSYKVIFGGEKIYLFLRMYCLLVDTLSRARNLLDSAKEGETAPVRKDTDETYQEDESVKPKYTGYNGLVALLKDHLSGGPTYAQYETWCRSLSKAKVAELASIPRILEKCREALAKVAKEDILHFLFDLSRFEQMKDLTLLRSESLKISHDAVYRIQYSSSDGQLSCTYLPPRIDLVTDASSVEVVEGGGQKECDGMEVDERVSKRQKRSSD